MTVPRITFAKDYVQDEHQRAFTSISNEVDKQTRQQRTIFAGTYNASAITSTTWSNFFTTFGSTNLYAGWVADKPGSVIALSVFDTATANSQQYAIVINNVPPTIQATRAQGLNVVMTFPLGQLAFKQGDLVQAWVRSKTTASTSFAATAHITVSVGA